MIFSPLLIALALAGDARADTDEEAHRLVHVLSYIANDYERAIAGGAVNNWDEYGEQLEMGETAGRIAAGLELARARAKDPIKLTPLIDQLRQLMEAKSDPGKVRAASEALAAKVIESFELRRAPRFPPNAERGKTLFAEHCASCHGASGRADTERAVALDPKPFNFHEQERAEHLTGYRVVNAVRFGVSETAMVPLDFLSEAERWDLAFYALSLRWAGVAAAPFEKAVSLADLAIRSDAELRAAFGAQDAAIAFLRTDGAFRLPVVQEPATRPKNFAIAYIAIAVFVVLTLLAALRRTRVAIFAAIAGAIVVAVVLFLRTREPETFDLTLKINTTVPIKEGYARVLTERDERTVRFRDNNEAFFPALPIAFRKEGARLEILTSPEVEPTWEPERLFPLDQAVLEVRAKLEKPPFAVVAIYKAGDKTETAVMERFHVAEEVVVETFVERAVMAFKVVKPEIPLASRFRALSQRHSRWLRGAADVEHLEPDETVLVLVDQEILKEQGEAPEPYLRAASEVLPKQR